MTFLGWSYAMTLNETKRLSDVVVLSVSPPPLLRIKRDRVRRRNIPQVRKEDDFYRMRVLLRSRTPTRIVETR